VICPSCLDDCDEAITRLGLGLHPACPAVESDPELVAAEVFTIVKDALLGSERSSQTRIGPSEMGHPCSRRVGHKLAGTPALVSKSVAWKPEVGTMIHAALAEIMAAHEIRSGDELTPRWHVEERVTVGTVCGEDITGTCDLFDSHGGIVIDWKTTSPAMLKRYRSSGPGDSYRTQAHLYGRGWQNAGHAVRHVMVIWLVRDGEYTDRHVWTEPYDEQAALDALERIETIRLALDAHGPAAVLPLLPVVESYCQNCDYFRRGEDDLTLGCPGAKEIPADPLEAMFA
jgi:hypothetical protein